ncbi:hypothetical protein FQN50_000089 [Emmonsiellopsis sp. PD_5]|nr:hypothetical protein FQN50_000089 [Emmonsiellopsis sp. PD_5]
MERSPWPNEHQEIPIEFSPRIPLPLDVPNPERYLGGGASAEVDLVYCNGTPLARKRIRLNHQSRHKLKEFSEGKILRKLSHEHVVRYSGSYIQGNTIGILMRPAATCNLAQFLRVVTKGPEDDVEQDICRAFDLRPWLDAPWIRKGGTPARIPQRVVLQRIVGCIANAMEYIHEQNIRHKDVKPENILLTPSSVFYADFGISQDISHLIRDHDDTRTSGPCVGTTRYIAPELASDKPRGRSADIFSLGCVFLEIIEVLNGISLKEFEATILESHDTTTLRFYNALPNIKRQLLAVKESNVARLHEGVYDLILSMMAEDPSARPLSSEVAELLYSFGGDRHIFHGPCCWTRNEPVSPKLISPKPVSPDAADVLATPMVERVMSVAPQLEDFSRAMRFINPPGKESWRRRHTVKGNQFLLPVRTLTGRNESDYIRCIALVDTGVRDQNIMSPEMYRQLGVTLLPTSTRYRNLGGELAIGEVENITFYEEGRAGPFSTENFTVSPMPPEADILLSREWIIKSGRW